MFTTLKNITILYDNGHRSITSFYELLYVNEIKIISQYFICDLIEIDQKLNSNSGTILLQKGRVHYTKSNNFIVYTYSEETSAINDLNLVETTELLCIQLLSKFGKLLEGKYDSLFGISHADIGNEIDFILGLSSINQNEEYYTHRFNILNKVKNSSIPPSDIVKEIINYFELENIDLIAFLNIFNKVRALIPLEEEFIRIEKELSRYIEMEKWLTS